MGHDRVHVFLVFALGLLAVGLVGLIHAGGREIEYLRARRGGVELQAVRAVRPLPGHGHRGPQPHPALALSVVVLIIALVRLRS
jgi:hypothetical protein